MLLKDTDYFVLLVITDLSIQKWHVEFLKALYSGPFLLKIFILSLVQNNKICYHNYAENLQM